jgi:hypothetical protein
VTWILRYRPDTNLGQRFPLTKYPWKGPGYPTREQAEHIRSLCINAEHIEVIEVED